MGNKFSLNKSKTILLILILILSLGTIFRLFWLDKSPPSLNWDEAALGYNAYSLMKTGKDEFGHKLPLVLRSFDDYKPALYSYLTIPFIKIFGLNEMGVRMLSAVSGIITILTIYFIADHFFTKRVALLASFLIAIEPWSVHFSRIAFEANLALSLLLIGILLALKSDKNPHLLFLSLPLIILSAYAYHANRILYLPIILGLIFYLRKKIPHHKYFKMAIFSLIVILTLPLLSILKSGTGVERFKSTSIIRLWKGNDISPLSLIDNPIYFFSSDLVGRYLSYFSPANLFVRGTNEPNQQISGFGPFYTIEFFFWITALFFLAKKRFKPRFLTFLIILSPIPATITWNWFLPTRALLLFALFSILTAWGLEYFISYIQKKGKILAISALFVLLILFSTNIANLATTLLFYIPYMEKGNWQFGFREIMNFVTPIQDNYDQIIFETGHAQPHIFTLFYSKYDPAKYHEELGSPEAVEKPRKNFDFGKYQFRNIFWPEDKMLKNTLFVGSKDSLPETDIKTVKNAVILSDIFDSQEGFVGRIVELQ